MSSQLPPKGTDLQSVAFADSLLSQGVCGNLITRFVRLKVLCYKCRRMVIISRTHVVTIDGNLNICFTKHNDLNHCNRRKILISRHLSTGLVLHQHLYVIALQVELPAVALWLHLELEPLIRAPMSRSVHLIQRSLSEKFLREGRRVWYRTKRLRVEREFLFATIRSLHSITTFELPTAYRGRLPAVLTPTYLLNATAEI